jgi:hypothetical protein
MTVAPLEPGDNVISVPSKILITTQTALNSYVGRSLEHGCRYRDSGNLVVSVDERFIVCSTQDERVPGSSSSLGFCCQWPVVAAESHPGCCMWWWQWGATQAAVCGGGGSGEPPRLRYVVVACSGESPRLRYVVVAAGSHPGCGMWWWQQGATQAAWEWCHIGLT